MDAQKMVLANAIAPVIESRYLALIRDIVFIFGAAVLTAMCAGLKLPIGLVPVTLQTFVVLLSGILLGSKRGAVAQIAYVSAGVAGVPWFSSGGGWQYIFSPTFGYLLGFIFAAYVVGLLAERGLDRKIITSIAAMIIGNMCIYFFGLLWLSKFIPQGHLLSIGLYPFIIGDALKILAAGILLPFVWKFLIIENKTNGF